MLGSILMLLLLGGKIISGHLFIDGNKRAGFEATDVFLRMNDYYIEVGTDEGLEFTLSKELLKNLPDLNLRLSIIQF